MKPNLLFIIISCILLLYNNPLFAQDERAVYYDLTFYSPHYRFHCLSEGGKMYIDKNDYALNQNRKIKDTVIGNVCKEQYGFDSVVVNYPFKENIDSARFNIIDNQGNRLATSAFDLIYITKPKPKIVECENRFTDEAMQLFKNLKPGDEIVLRNIHAWRKDEYVNSFAPFKIYVK